MQNEINTIIQEFFHKDNADNVQQHELDHFISKYPYVAPARFLIAKKKFEQGGEPNADVITAGLYFNNPLWLSWQLQNVEKEEPPVHEELPQTPAKAEEESPIAFQSYHTIDYFASQGIRLQQAELSRDRLGQQLKSFTEWLRSMKKLPLAEGQPPATPEDDTRQQVVIQNAASSIQEKEVLTEAMAEVWLKQGNNAKAAEIYYKLSLLNPSKSSYFAAKIDQLK
jgi:hypothetical protein